MPSLNNLTSKIQSEMFFNFLAQLRDLWWESKFPKEDALGIEINLRLSYLRESRNKTAEQGLRFKSILK